MKIAIISDVHNNIVNLKKVLTYCEKNEIKKIICCGDLASKETLDFFCDNYKGEIFFTFGNMDEGQLKIELLEYPETNKYKDASENSYNDRHTYARTYEGTYEDNDEHIVFYKNAKVFRKFGETEIDNKKIAFIHFPNEAKKMCQNGKYDFVFYGHTHKPWEEKIGNCKMLNPGNVANEIYLPTFAVWNTENDNFKLIRVNEIDQGEAV